MQEVNLQTSYLFDTNCHFHAVHATLLNRNVHLKLQIFLGEFPLSELVYYTCRWRLASRYDGEVSSISVDVRRDGSLDCL